MLYLLALEHSVLCSGLTEAYCSVLLSLLQVMIVVDRSRDIPHLIRFLKTCIKEGNGRNSPQVSVEEETG
jgi:hypothetical protein